MEASVKNILMMYRFFSRSQGSLGLRRGSAAAHFLELQVRVSLRLWKCASCEYCVLSGRGVRVGLITRPEDTY